MFPAGSLQHPDHWDVTERGHFPPLDLVTKLLPSMLHLLNNQRQQHI